MPSPAVRIGVVAGLWLGGVAVGGPPGGRESVERLKADVYYFASVTLEGRGVSTPGIDLAANHVRSEFRRLGLKSGTRDGTYFQPFPFGRDTGAGPERTLRNVIGVLEGEGMLADETIVIGAHYDHLGYGPSGPGSPRGRLHPGADDNASGTSAMMELARRFAGRGRPPRRRMVFIAFSAEESGRVGSRYYASKEPGFPIKDTVAMINFDMVGRLRDDELGVAGNESAAEFRALLAAADDRSPLRLRLGEVGVPILYFCTGSSEDRHTPGDSADPDADVPPPRELSRSGGALAGGGPSDKIRGAGALRNGASPMNRRPDGRPPDGAPRRWGTPRSTLWPRIPGTSSRSSA